MSDSLLRPEVLACQRAADEAMDVADIASGAALFWASLNDHGHPYSECCDEPDCLQAWRLYPDG